MAEEALKTLRQIAAILRRHAAWQVLPWGVKQILSRYLPEEPRPIGGASLNATLVEIVALVIDGRLEGKVYLDGRLVYSNV